MKTTFDALKVFFGLTFILGVLYPFVVMFTGQMFFHEQANGSLVKINGQLRGSILLAQKFENPKYFWPRPSAGDYATVASGASNLSPTSQKLLEQIEGRKKTLGSEAPADLLMASGSGLDPHIGLSAALYQVSRVAQARNLDANHVKTLVLNSLEPRQWGLLGQERVNVLKLNLFLDQESSLSLK